MRESGRKLLQTWIKRLNGDLHLFLKSIDVENNMQLAEDVLTMILEDVVRDKDRLDQVVSTLVEQLDGERCAPLHIYRLYTELLVQSYSRTWEMTGPTGCHQRRRRAGTS